MPTTTTSLTPSAFSDGLRIVEKSRGTAHPEGHPARRAARAAAPSAARRRRPGHQERPVTGY
jgi:hypothetical protein